MSAEELRVGANIRRIREGQKFSQKTVARLMRERGWKWHQATVPTVESGERKLGLVEAFDLARVFGVSLEQLTGISSTTAPPAGDSARNALVEIHRYVEMALGRDWNWAEIARRGRAAQYQAFDLTTPEGRAAQDAADKGTNP